MLPPEQRSTLNLHWPVQTAGQIGGVGFGVVWVSATASERGSAALQLSKRLLSFKNVTTWSRLCHGLCHGQMKKFPNKTRFVTTSRSFHPAKGV